MVRQFATVFAIRFAAILAVLAMLPGSGAGRVRAQDKQAVYDQVLIDFAVQPDGRVLVTEDQRVDFQQGSFTTGYVELDTRGSTDIELIDMGEPERPYYPGHGQPYTYEVTHDGNIVRVRWWFPETEHAERRFVIRYVLQGALRFYEGGDQLWWKAVRPKRPHINKAVMTVVLPPNVPAITRATAYRLPGDDRLPVDRVDDRTMRVSATDIPRDTTIEVRAEWPHGVIPGTPSPFQARLDRERAGEQAQIEAARAGSATTSQIALLNLVTGFLGLLVLLGGLFGLYMLWYSRGRDMPVLAPADYLAEPPSELAPGLAGTLLDERADLPDILATLIDLARRGELRMEETVEAQFLGLWDKHDFVFHHTPSGSPLAPHEEQLVAIFFGDEPRRVLSDLKQKFYEHLPALQEALYEAVVGTGLFDASPQRTRQRYALLGVAGLVVAGLMLYGAFSLAASVPAVLLLPAAMAVVAGGGLLLARYMPRKTPAGAEAAARWRAFRRYLADIERYRDLNEAKDIFDRYLPFAIAFGLDREWIAKFTRVDAAAPPWFAPLAPGGGWWGRPWDGGSLPDQAGLPAGPVMVGESDAGEAGGGRLPDLQRSSEGFGRGLQGMSTSLSRLLATAAAVLPSQPESSGGGGWSGGGFSGGGGGGGGGGGFG